MTDESTPSGALDVLLAAAERLLRAEGDRIVATVAAMLADRAPTTEERLVSPNEAARACGVSRATWNRYAAEPGFPTHVVGARRRYRVTECRTWFAARGRRAATAKVRPPAEDSIDTSRVLRRAGLRAVGGA